MRENTLLKEHITALEEGTVVAGAYRDAYMDLYRKVNGAENELAAEVLLRPPVSAYDYYLINKGTHHGVSEQSFVVAGGYYTLGFVSHSSEYQSQVALFSRPGNDFIVSVDGSLYRARGQGGGVVHVELPRVYRNKEVPLAVRIPGAGPYLLGWVQDISFDPQDSMVIGIVSLGENIFEQEIVRVSDLVYQDQETLADIIDISPDEETTN